MASRYGKKSHEPATPSLIHGAQTEEN